MTWYMPKAQHIAVNGVNFAYDDVGKGSAILFIHGFMLDRTVWRNQVAALDRWRRITPDLRGHGLSEAPKLGYSMATYADDLTALLESDAPLALGRWTAVQTRLRTSSRQRSWLKSRRIKSRSSFGR